MPVHESDQPVGDERGDEHERRSDEREDAAECRRRRPGCVVLRDGGFVSLVNLLRELLQMLLLRLAAYPAPGAGAANPSRHLPSRTICLRCGGRARPI